MPFATRVILTIALLSPAAFAQDRSYARSMVVTRYGIVATSHVQASQAGAQILAHGGSAADAAIAANAVLGVTEPMMNGIGGDLFVLYWDAKTGKLYGLNASGWAPQGLTIGHLKAKDVTSMPQSGIDTVTVPGAVAGWNALGVSPGRIFFSLQFSMPMRDTPSRNSFTGSGKIQSMICFGTVKAAVCFCTTISLRP